MPEDLERLTELLEEVLERSGYVHARVEGSTRMKIRRLVRRMDLRRARRRSLARNAAADSLEVGILTS